MINKQEYIEKIGEVKRKINKLSKEIQSFKGLSWEAWTRHSETQKEIKKQRVQLDQVAKEYYSKNHTIDTRGDSFPSR